MLTPVIRRVPDRVGGRAGRRPRAARACGACSSPASRAAASRRSARGSKPAGARRSPRRWGSATSASRSGASASSRTECTSAPAGFVHAELIDPDTGAPARARPTGRAGELVLTHLRHRAAPLLRFRTRDHVEVRTESVQLRPHRSAGPLHRAHRRHADRARRERLPVRGPRGGQRLRAGGQRPASSSSREPRASSRSRRCRSASSSPRGQRPTRRWRKRSARDCATCWSSRRTSSSCRGEPCSGASTSRNSSSASRGEAMRKLQTQGVHHITLVGADRQTSIDFWEGVLGMPFVFEQPNLDNGLESHLYFDPGDGRLITVFTNEERVPDPQRTPDRPRLRPPHRVRRLAGDLPAGRRAARRARHPAQRRQGPRLHGLDLLRGPARPADRARVATGSSRPPASRTPRCCSRPTGSASSAATTTSPRSTSPTRSRCSSAARASRSRRPLAEEPLPAGPHLQPSE